VIKENKIRYYFSFLTYLSIMITEEKKAQNIRMVREFLADQKLMRQYMHGGITLEPLKKHGIKLVMPL
jgi:hypothetical protein